MVAKSFSAVSLATAAIAFGAVLVAGPALAKQCCSRYSPDAVMKEGNVCWAAPMNVEGGTYSEEQKQWCTKCGKKKGQGTIREGWKYVYQLPVWQNNYCVMND